MSRKVLAGLVLGAALFAPTAAHAAACDVAEVSTGSAEVDDAVSAASVSVCEAVSTA